MVLLRNSAKWQQELLQIPLDLIQEVFKNLKFSYVRMTSET